MTRSVLALTLTLGLVLASQSVSPAAQTSDPVTLTLRLAGERRQFRPGEIIPVELIFESRVPKRYVVDGASYDRSGRLTIDEFRVSPIELVTDPMLDYFASSGAFIGGGLRGMWTLDGKPYAVLRQLNELFRFDTPGTFTLSVRSSRVTDESIGTRATPVVVPLESNSITFEILPRDESWEAAEFGRARQMLSDAQRQTRATGCQILRFLGSTAAIDAMVQRYDDEECRFDAMAGLFSAPNRAYVVEQLEAGLSAPTQAVTRSYLQTLARLSLYLRQPELRPAQTAEAKGRLQGGGELARRPELVQAEIDRYAQLLRAALPLKTGAAHAVSSAEHAEAVRLSPSAPATAAAAARQQLIASFAALPASRQETLLRLQWRSVADPALLPALRTLAAGSSQFADLALRRLYQLAPTEGRPLVLERIRRPTQGSTLETLGILPDETLPELDDTLARNVETAITDINTALLHRYASPAIAPRVLNRITLDVGQQFACAPQANAIAYFLRVRPDYGVALLERALASRERTSCYQRVLADVARRHMTPELESRMIAALDDDHPQVVLSTIEALSRFGSEAARPALRVHFESWNRAWQGRAGELRYNHTLGINAPGAVNGSIETAYLRSLASAQGWLTDGNEIAVLRDLCVTESCRSTANMLGQAGDTRISVLRLDGPTDISAQLALQEFTSLAALGKKLSQYPKGTTFTVRATGDPTTARTISAELSAWITAQGMRVRP